MELDPGSLNKIATVFQNNLGNRLTLELANGMVQEILKCLPQDNQGPANDHNTTTNPSTE